MPKKGSLIKSFGYAFQGIFTSLAKERNLKIHFVIAILVVVFYLKVRKKHSKEM